MWNSRGTPQIFGLAVNRVHPVCRSFDYCISRTIALRGHTAGATLRSKKPNNAIISDFYTRAIMAAKKQKRRISRPWTKDDVKNLRGFAKDRLSGSQAAKKLRRTPGAVAQKAMTLGIRFRSINRKGKAA
jgi:hypothetical protein